MIRKFLAGLALGGFAFIANPAAAQECEVTVDSNDQMQFDTDNVEIPKSCSEFTVKLTHSGQLPKSAMGHNWVMTTQEDMQAVNADGIAAGLDNDYLKPNDERVIAATALIGGGEEDSVTFSTENLEAGGNYMFFCSFPGHSSVMKGTVTVTE